jgi:serine/threonine protein kinase
MLLTYGIYQQLGAEIGRGGFAVVFQALNVETGDFVAVKRFPLSTVDEESLASIEVTLCATFFKEL